jgi:hypothetical protein
MQVVDRVNGEGFRKAVAPACADFAKEFGADKIAAVQAVQQGRMRILLLQINRWFTGTAWALAACCWP